MRRRFIEFLLPRLARRVQQAGRDKVKARMSLTSWSQAAFSLVLVTLTVSCSVAHDRDRQLAGNEFMVVRTLNDRLSRDLGARFEEVRSQYCIPRARADRTCLLVRAPYDPPACQIQEADCRAVELRADLFADPQVSLAIRSAREVCSYFDPSTQRTVNEVGCVAPDPGFRLVYSEKPTICVLLLDPSAQHRISRIAFKDGHPFRSAWCDRFSVQS